MHINLPEKFESILTGKYRALVDLHLATYEPILKDNRLKFFPDFTDHGIDHIQSVINSACNLITDETLNELNEKDVAVLVLAIVLHDIGMHLGESGLQKLLDGGFDKYRNQFFDVMSWREEWESFYREFKRYNDEQLTNIFNHANVVIENPSPALLDDQTCRLYGEFLRRLHPRLAHEIAIGGFPTISDEENIKVPYSNDLENLVELSGLLARSHGMPLRSTFDYLMGDYQEAWRNPFDVKIVYLMAVLRIADYLQINSDRAPQILLRAKRLESPVSIQEWEKHNAIKDVSISTTDPEKVYVIANPTNSRVYLELESLFKDIQTELDTCWAILGEVYGNITNLSKLGIKYRRIRSTLDEKQKFSSRVDYLPERVVFNADPEILKLLIGPLYGEDPKYGVRELLQNAVDASRERQFLDQQETEIRIELKRNLNDYVLSIVDSGIGMSDDTLINYFFKAGASFRKSMSWKKSFVGAEGAQIQKTGRFGVGVLAVFLLGDDFELSTRFNSPSAQGYYCKASLSSKQIEVIKVECEVGTAIKIKLKPEVKNLIDKHLEASTKGKAQILDWFYWFKLDSPRIIYEIDQDLKQILPTPKMSLSSQPNMTSLGWYKFSTPGYAMIHWTIPLDSSYNVVSVVQDGEMICNGFLINRKYKITEGSYRWIAPNISIFDNNGKLPLSLNRDYIENDKLPFEGELIFALVREIIRNLLEVDFVRKGHFYLPKEKLIQFGAKTFDLADFIVVSKDHYTLLDQVIMKQLEVDRLFQLWHKGSLEKAETPFLNPDSFYQSRSVQSETIRFFKNKMDPYYYDERRLNHWFSIGNRQFFERGDFGARIYLKKEKFEYLNVPKLNRLRPNFVKTLQGKSSTGTWATFERHGDKKFSENGEHVRHAMAKPLGINTKSLTDSHLLVIEHLLRTNSGLNTFFFNAWNRLLGPKWLISIDHANRPQMRFNEDLINLS